MYQVTGSAGKPRMTQSRKEKEKGVETDGAAMVRSHVGNSSNGRGRSTDEDWERLTIA